MRRVPIRLKLAAALSIPLFALGVVTVLEVLKSADDVSQVRSQTALAEAAVGPRGLITALQDERSWPAVDLIGQAGMVTLNESGYDETRSKADEAVAAFRDELASKDAAIREAFEPALDGLAGLEQIRADIDANLEANPEPGIENIGFANDTFGRYTELISPFFEATTRISLAIDDPELRQGTEMADASARQIEEMSLLLRGVIADYTLSDGGIDTPAEITRNSIDRANFERNAEVMVSGTGPYARIADEHFPAELTEGILEQTQRAITTNTMELETILGAANVPREEGVWPYQSAVADEIASRSDELNAAAEARQRWFVALSVLVLGVALVLTWLVSRSITRPLRALTREAKEMAERRLPQAVLAILDTPLGDDVQVPQVAPVRLATRDEVADVSDALNTVQDTALDLAVEQAVLRRNIADSFVNLGRRNQNLLGRQLDFITELEAHESDPDTLGNLFRLDHLATRMRRNAESLLVLAGIEPPRKWAAPVRLNDVIRAALGEVEDYQRVTVRGVDPATIIGSAAADLAHLLAELIENALVFSPPDQTVDIRGRNRPDGYTLAVIDSGLGMPPDDITAANRRLAGAESFTIAPSKYLGHYVAGNLAARHEIKVHLANSPGNGVTATIDLPPALLTDDAARPQADEPHAARDVWPPAPRAGEGRPAPLPPAPPRTGPAHLPSSGPAHLPSPGPAPLPAADGGDDARFAGLTPPDPSRRVAFPRADFGTTAPIPAYGHGGPGGGDGHEGGGYGGRGNGGPHDARTGPDAPWADSPWATGPGPDRPAPAPGSPWSSTPAASADSVGGPFGRQSAPTDESEARRTPSGLVKRTPRVVDTGEIQAVGQSPDDDLLASLSRFTGSTPAVRPSAPPLPPRRAASPPAQPPTSGMGGLAAGLSGLSPFEGTRSRPAATPPSSAGRGPGSSAPGAGSFGGLSGRPSGGASGPAAGSDTTGGGLTRRVRGAQLPNTTPVSLHRSGGGGAAAAGPAPAPGPVPAPPPGPPASVGASPARTPEQQQSADAVYSFLSSFTAGVQRGLDDARRDGPSH